MSWVCCHFSNWVRLMKTGHAFERSSRFVAVDDEEHGVSSEDSCVPPEAWLRFEARRARLSKRASAWLDLTLAGDRSSAVLTFIDGKNKQYE